jgi:putative copper export protein
LGFVVGAISIGTLRLPDRYLKGRIMSLMLLLHLVFAGAWLGCILVEALFEHGSGGGSDMRLFISKLHWRVDLLIEIPAFAGVLLTGGFLIAEASMTPLLWTKTAFGMIAILFNIACVWLVRVRLGHALSGDAESWQRADDWQHKLGAVVLAALLIALVIGAYAQAGAG